MQLKRNIIKFVYFWIPFLTWLSIIFYMSSQVRISITKQSNFDFIIFKTLHTIEYAFLYFLLFRAIYGYTNKKFLLWTSFIAIVICTVLAATDEFHQSFIITREGKLRDVFIDAFGILVMYSIIKRKMRFFKYFL